MIIPLPFISPNSHLQDARNGTVATTGQENFHAHFVSIIDAILVPQPASKQASGDIQNKTDSSMACSGLEQCETAPNAPQSLGTVVPQTFVKDIAAAARPTIEAQQQEKANATVEPGATDNAPGRIDQITVIQVQPPIVQLPTEAHADKPSRPTETRALTSASANIVRAGQETSLKRQPTVEAVCSGKSAVPLAIEPAQLAFVGTLQNDMAIEVPALQEAPSPSLDMGDRDWIARLSQEIVKAHQGGNDISFRLAPQHLGTLDIGIRETGNGLVIEMRCSAPDAAAHISREEPRLIDELRQRGVPLAETSLQFGANGDSRNSRNGAVPRPVQPFPYVDQNAVQDQDRHQRRPAGRFA